jgi:PAS domain-containing protein
MNNNLTKHLLLQVCKELIDASLIFKVKQNGFKVELVANPYQKLIIGPSGNQEHDFHNLSLNQLFSQKKLYYITKSELLESFRKVVEKKQIHEINDIKLGVSDNSGQQKAFKITNIPILDADKKVSYIVHKITHNVDAPREELTGTIESLKKSLEIHKSMQQQTFKESPLPIIKMDLEGMVLEANPAFSEQVAILKPSNMQNALVRLFPKDLETQLIHHIQKAAEGHPQQLQVSMDHDSREVKIFGLHLLPIQIENEVSHIHGIFIDRSQLKWSQKELIHKSILLENCLQLNEILSNTNLPQDAMGKCLGFMLDKFEVGGVHFFYKPSADGQEMLQLAELVANWRTVYSFDSLEFKHILQERGGAIPSYPFLLKTAQLKQKDLKRLMRESDVEQVLCIPVMRKKELRFLVMLTDDKTIKLGIEERNICSIMASFIYAEFQQLQGGEMVSVFQN